jgi:peptidoglycan/xylan/chitin deacetylase (PgdA/CDA1 family)
MRKTVGFLYPDGKIKALTMSYDDGVTEDRRLVEIFNRHKIKGSFHINAGLLGDGKRKIDLSEAPSLYKGHEISCHGFTHATLDKISRTEVVREMLDDRLALEKTAGYPVRGMSYPNGGWSGAVTETLAQLGIVYGRTVMSTGGFGLPENFLAWHPTCHHNHGIMEKLEAFRKNGAALALFYVWGHSYEFPRDNNWELIEGFCAAVSGDENIWFATNIEIYDYITALRRLEFSADSSIVKNPSAMTLWLRVCGEKITVGPGELKAL